MDGRRASAWARPARSEAAARSPEAELRSLRERAYAILAQRDHSRTELARKLGLELDAPLLDELQQAGYLDERRFAESFARSRRRRGLGRERILAELRQRGVERELAFQATEEDDFEQACELARGRLARGKSAEQAMRFLLQRGFGPSLARRAVLGATRPEESSQG